MMTAATSWSFEDGRRTGTVAALALAPYLAFPFPHQTGLGIQAVTLGLLLLSVVILAPRGPRWPREVPGPVLWGFALWAMVAAWGFCFGLIYANPLRYVASQTVSMGMLAAGGMAFLTDRCFRPRHLRRGLAIAAVGALFLQVILGVGSARFLATGASFRGKLSNDVGIGALAPLLFLVLGASWLAYRDRGSLLGTAAAFLLVLTEMSRGAWLTCLLGGILLILSMRRWSTHLAVRLALAIAILAGAALSLASWSEARTQTVVHLDWAQPEESHVQTDSLGNLPDPARGPPALHATPSSGDWRTLTPGLSVSGHGVEVLVDAIGPPGRHLTLRIEVFDRGGRRIGRSHGSLGGTGQWRSTGLVRALAPSESFVRASVWAAAGQGDWTIRRLSFRSVPDPLTAWLRAATHRVSELPASLLHPGSDRTLGYRLRESRAVLAAWEKTSMLRRITGQGLGAQFAFENKAWNDEGRRIVRTEASYIHNFFLFLGFKLGFMGLVALAGLLLLAWWSGLRLYRCEEGCWIFAAAFSVWISYLVWGITSPQIYDFRVAPFFGLLVASCVRAQTASSTLEASDSAPAEPAS